MDTAAQAAGVDAIWITSGGQDALGQGTAAQAPRVMTADVQRTCNAWSTAMR
ncbi:hypothetical protein OZ411_40855 [Bradyrhizobium sp. Arg237L]|uniref:hypothetical protein n=1 Tax=Bradyrhizobium sp. Arg237L TaxID=3003352 RepID=UPI00249E14C5|nr:hypothetical protein [Bradyrhizobium sp. Arg237L]MDI4239145.1 hypothetical protein [Bradyrhizobium sp. Arg237L]